MIFTYRLLHSDVRVASFWFIRFHGSVNPNLTNVSLDWLSRESLNRKTMGTSPRQVGVSIQWLLVPNFQCRSSADSLGFPTCWTLWRQACAQFNHWISGSVHASFGLIEHIFPMDFPIADAYRLSKSKNRPTDRNVPCCWSDGTWPFYGWFIDDLPIHWMVLLKSTKG